MKKNLVFCICLGVLTHSIAQAHNGRIDRPGSVDGGMSGGGGNVLPGKLPDAPLDPEEAEDQVKASRHTAVDYLTSFKEKYQQGALPSDQASLAQKAFSKGRDLLTISRTYRTDVEDDSPCFDFSGSPVDGSIRGERPNEICISSHSIAKKVHQSEIKAQSAALMIHEFSEVIGFSEDEATALQVQVYTDLMK